MNGNHSVHILFAILINLQQYRSITDILCQIKTSTFFANIWNNIKCNTAYRNICSNISWHFFSVNIFLLYFLCLEIVGWLMNIIQFMTIKYKTNLLVGRQQISKIIDYPLKNQADGQPWQQKNGGEKIFFHGLMCIFTV